MVLERRKDTKILFYSYLGYFLKKNNPASTFPVQQNNPLFFIIVVVVDTTTMKHLLMTSC